MTKTKKETEKQEEVRFQKQLRDELLRLSTSALGLVAALAWNDLIKKLITDYIEPFVGKDSSVISMLIYTLIVTVLAVAVTYQLSKIKGKS